MRKLLHSTVALSATLGLLAACSGGSDTATDEEVAEAPDEEGTGTYENGIPMFPLVDESEVELSSEDGERKAEFTLDGPPFRAIDHYGPVFTANGWENGAGTADATNPDGSIRRTLNAATGSDGTVRVTVGAVGAPAEGDTFENGVPAYPNIIPDSINVSSGAGQLVNVTFDTTDTVLSVMNFYSAAFEEAGVPNRMLVYTAGDQGEGPGGRITVNRDNKVRVTYHGGE